MSKKGKQHPQATQVRSQLAKADQLLKQRNWGEARTLLLRLTAAHPNNVEAWTMLAEALHRLKNNRESWWALQSLLRLEPDVEVHWMNVISSAVLNGMPFVALDYIHTFLERFPEGQYSAETRQHQADLEPIIAQIRTTPHLPPDATDDDFREMEQATIALESGEYDLAEKLARRILARAPHFVAPANNLSMVLAIQGHFEDAIQRAQFVLEHEPENIHARANLVQFYVRIGQFDEAQQHANQLLQHTLDAATLPKIGEALAYLGDDQALVRLFEQANSQLSHLDDSRYINIYYYAAVAYAHLGDEKRARELWQHIPKQAPVYKLAEQNLLNLRQPIGKRAPAFPFSLLDWVPVTWINELTEAATRRNIDEKALRTLIEQFLDAHPALLMLIPTLLARGDAETREFVLQLGSLAHLPLLLDFALGDKGTDIERMEAAQIVTEFGLLPRGKPIALLIEGKRKEMVLMAYEITEKPEKSKNPSAQRDIEAIHRLLSGGQFVKAESTARAALLKAPDERTLWNYLNVALEGQEKHDEAYALTEELAKRFPDYRFAQLSLVRLWVKQGKLAEARQLLAPFAEQPSFHISEFKALCVANIELCIAEKRKDVAQSWLQMWGHLMPDDPNVYHFAHLLR